MNRVFLPVLGTVQPLGEAAIPADPLVDAFARRIRYLRVSVTDRCNYRCTYCMPEDLGDRLVFEQRSAVLSFEEITRLVGVFAKLGVRKLRLTGGEPTVRKGIVDLVRQVAQVPGIEQVVMTSNGHLLGELAAPLAAAGISTINISVDTLDPAKFSGLTGRGDLARVLAGIDAALAAGIRVKLNAVALHGVNDGELVALCEYAWARGAIPRFIEHMPMSGGQLYAPTSELNAAQIRRRIEAEIGPLVASAGTGRDAGPARYWQVASDPRREVGIISAMTEHFCDDCNRLRLTATGALHACLGHDDAISLRDILRRGGTDDDLVGAIAAAVTGKRAGHTFERTGAGAPQKHMIGIGG
ncbi:MAG: GTP 3',8-cyclase MoaA [Deltaproteobacteria bacterium]|nr:GTP 3',8-cyclase MoaA [Deltaproteobacteria bacterium]MDQ3295248.1 GTP 3',8-cyclase MoaA [Myxococcota bacterium]